MRKLEYVCTMGVSIMVAEHYGQPPQNGFRDPTLEILIADCDEEEYRVRERWPSSLIQTHTMRRIYKEICNTIFAAGRWGKVPWESRTLRSHRPTSISCSLPTVCYHLDKVNLKPTKWHPSWLRELVRLRARLFMHGPSPRQREYSIIPPDPHHPLMIPLQLWTTKDLTVCGHHPCQ